MPNRLKDLSGKEIIKFLGQNGFSVQKTHGSHCKLRRVVSGCNQTLLIPNHNSVAKGTLRDIYNQISEYLPGPDTKDFFFAK